MKRITFIDPHHQLYEFSTDKVRTKFLAKNYFLYIRRGKFSLEISMMTNTVRWEEYLDLHHTIVHLREKFSDEQINTLSKLGKFNSIAEFKVVGKSPREYWNHDIYVLKKLKSQYSRRKEAIEQVNHARDREKKAALSEAAENFL